MQSKAFRWGKQPPPKKRLPLPVEGSGLGSSGLPPNTWFLGRTLVHIPNGVSIGSAVFAGLASGDHRQRIDKYLDTLLANQTPRKAMPPTTAKRGHRKMADCPSYYQM